MTGLAGAPASVGDLNDFRRRPEAWWLRTHNSGKSQTVLLKNMCKIRAPLLASVVILSATSSIGQISPTVESYDWRADWEIPTGYYLEVDASGFALPSAIAFVPSPGENPDDPLYFVTELRGKVKVVTNDRTVVTFADDLGNFIPTAELPDAAGQSGLAGICLEPRRGYVFVTFMYRDKQGIPRNNIVRFRTQRGTFGLEPVEKVEFTEVFLPHESGLAHHIGGCQIRDDLLYVGIGDGWQAPRSRQLEHFNGKLIRMTLDGRPADSNPFNDGDGSAEASDYVWAYGLRNPFGLEIVGNDVFVADNGVGIDRFLKVSEGVNYLWDGTDVSLASNADFVWTTSIGPAQVDYVGDIEYMDPTFRRTFFIAGAGAMDQGTPEKMPRISAVPYAVDRNMVVGTPRDFVVYRGEPYQLVVGVAAGPDALYFVPILPDGEGRTRILKIRRALETDDVHPVFLGVNVRPIDIMKAKGCVGCHTINGRWGYGGAYGPDLGKSLVPRLVEKLSSEQYRMQLMAMDSISLEPQVQFQEARGQLLDAYGEDRVRIFLNNFLREPRFDRPTVMMPQLELSSSEIEIVVDYLFDLNRDAQTVEKGLLETLVYKVRSTGLRRVVFFIGFGFVIGAAMVFVVMRFSRRATTGAASS